MIGVDTHMTDEIVIASHILRVCRLIPAAGDTTTPNVHPIRLTGAHAADTPRSLPGLTRDSMPLGEPTGVRIGGVHPHTELFDNIQHCDIIPILHE